ncbi:hypothetical protein HMPREF9534_03380 [Escherichia coli MS 69-1]|nr:hypothetical protein HMPREF9534_03380 [Escherichia coli MS 69-1]ESD85941.1 hypothetical protein HMPREF1611_02399 [Escherichia coli 908573]
MFHQDNTLFFNLHAVDPAGYDPRCNAYLSVFGYFSDKDQATWPMIK